MLALAVEILSVYYKNIKIITLHEDVIIWGVRLLFLINLFLVSGREYGTVVWF